MMYFSFGLVMKRVSILLLTTSTLSTEPSNSPQKFLTNRSTSWMCLSTRSMACRSLTFTRSIQTLTSRHPRHCKNGIAYSQALRFCRIYSNDFDFSHHAQNLKMHIVSRISEFLSCKSSCVEECSPLLSRNIWFNKVSKIFWCPIMHNFINNEAQLVYESLFKF